MITDAAFIAFAVLGIVTLGATLGAVAMRDPVHCGLALALAFCGVGGFYILLGAEFLGFIQLLVYVGAVAVLIMFVILLTRRPDSGQDTNSRGFWSALAGSGVALGVFAVLAVAISRSPSIQTATPADPEASIAAIGRMLVSSHLLPLKMIGVLLTVALIGGVLGAMQEGGKLER